MEQLSMEKVYVAQNVAQVMGEILARSCVVPCDIDAELERNRQNDEEQ